MSSTKKNAKILIVDAITAMREARKLTKVDTAPSLHLWDAIVAAERAWVSIDKEETHNG